MKRKFINGFLVAAALVGGMSTMSSCKDNTEDIRVEMGEETQKLKNQIQSLIGQLEACKQSCEQKFQGNVNASNLEEYLKNSAYIAELERKISGLETLLGEMPEDSNYDNFADWIAAIGATAGTNSAYLEEVMKEYTSEEFYDAIEAASWVKEQKERIEVMMQTVEAMGEAFNDFIQTLNDWRDAIDEKFDAIDTDILDLKEGYQGLSNKIKNELVPQIQANKEAIEEIQAIMKRQVTSILIQGTHNPVFGSFSAPFGITSNILMLHYGYAGAPVSFPNTDSAVEYDVENPFTEAQVAALAKTGIDIDAPIVSYSANQALVSEKIGNAGKVYMTVNPSTVSFEGQTVDLVNSQDELSGVTLSSLRKSDKVLSFGFGRADNGFYEADATLAPENIQSVKVEIEPGLKTAFKDAFDNRTKADFAYLIKQLYNQFNGILPAQGLKATYASFNNAPASVYSEYAIAATAFKPLSYGFLAGQGLGHKLPIISPINADEFKLDTEGLDFNITIPDINIEGGEFNFEFKPISLEVRDGILYVEVQMSHFDKTDTGYVNIGYTIDVFPVSGVEDFMAELENAFNENIGEWNESLKAAFEDYVNGLIANINEQVNSAMESVSGQVSDKLTDVIDNINAQLQDKIGGYVDRFNGLIDKYNNLAQRLNKYLENPNHFMQPMMVYNYGQGNIGQVSTGKAVPTLFHKKGGDAIELILTSYNAEIAAPAFKKYVVVTNVYDVATGKSVLDDDADCIQLMKDANAATFFNQALEGNQLRVALKVGKPGYKYEIVYQGLDYHGVTSTNTYYIQVAE